MGLKAESILKDLYNLGYIETIYNTQNEKHRKEGWVLKNGSWTPWYFNLRPVGYTPKLVSEIARAMNQMVMNEVPGLGQIVGIEMAGVPLAAAIGTASPDFIPYAYTRPLPGEKVRTPEEARRVLEKFKEDFGYGGKELVEGRFQDGQVLCIVDDMVTDFGSKLIAKLIIEYEMERRGINGVQINDVAVVLDREQGAEAEADKNGMCMHSLIKFKTEGLGWLEDIMKPEEHRLIFDFQVNPRRYQSKELQELVLAEANRLKGGR